MSGGVGPTADISLPKEEEHHPPPHDQPSTTHPKNSSHNQKPSSSFLTFRQLNSLAIMIVLAASGMVSLGNFIIVLFSILYMLFLSKSIFPTILSPLSSHHQPPIFDPNSRILTLYIQFAAIIGLFLPILYIFEGILEGDKDGIKAAVPHVFLLATQVFLEGFAFSERFSLPIRVFVPVFYNSCRVFTLVEWLSEEMVKVVGEGSMRRLYVGRGLAIANFVLWCYNLFGFLLPVYLPRAFKRYYDAGNGSVSSGTSKRD